MTCGDARQVLSAAMDGEQTGRPVTRARAHLDGCAQCRHWQAAVEQINRLVRIHPAERIPDATERVLAAVHADPTVRTAAAGFSRRRQLLRIGVAVAAVAQLLLGLPELVMCLAGTRGSHASHEMAAFDLAVSIGFLLAAWKPERARALVPVAVVLSAALLLVAGVDIAHSTIALAHELAHLVAVGQAVLLWALGRRSGGPRTADPATIESAA